MSPPEIVRVDLDAILDLRWRVLAPDRPRAHARMPHDHADTTRHWALRVDGVVVGCATVLALRGWALRGMAVDAAHRRRGVGSALLAAVVREVDAPMWCNARLDAVGFYRTSGWVEAGPRFELAGAGTHQRMTWRPHPAP